MITAERLEEIRQHSNLFGSANGRTGSTGLLAKFIHETTSRPRTTNRRSTFASCAEPRGRQLDDITDRPSYRRRYRLAIVSRDGSEHRVHRPRASRGRIINGRCRVGIVATQVGKRTGGLRLPMIGKGGIDGKG